MRVVVTVEMRFERTPDGQVWTWSGFTHDFWRRYLDAFDAVRVVARVRDVPEPVEGSRRSTGEGVAFAAVPHYHGPAQFLPRAPAVVRAVRAAIGPGDAVLLRIGSLLASCAQPVLRRDDHPYGVEVVGDPWDMFAPGTVRHPLRPFFRHWFTRKQREQCAGACGALYVTAGALQRRYPCPAHMVGVSDVEIDEVVAGRSIPDHPGRRRIVTVGTLEQLYKAPDVLIRAVARCVRDGIDLELSLVGDGAFRDMLERLAADAGLSGRVTFHGWLPAGGPVRERLDAADLFVLPSRQEGLPRALVEAMARGLPSIGSTVGGIPELLHADDLVPPDDEEALAARIREVVTTPGRMAAMSLRNLQAARAYLRPTLERRRGDFYRHVRRVTEAWRAGREAA